MTVLLSISILAFCTLLWASLAVARHLRRATPTPLKKLGHAERDHAARRSSHTLRESR